ncbi:MAG: hypothetical protein GY953_16960, partial [bacterium]|nr:hypothetical protein [bacterium]
MSFHRFVLQVTAAALLFACTGAAADGTRAIRVDAARPAGAIRSLQGVNVGPAHTRPGVGDITEQYRRLRIDT